MPTSKDDGVTAVLGTMMMLAMMAVLAVPVMGLVNDNKALLEAERIATQKAAWCVRNPDVGPPECPSYGPMPGYDCRYVKPGTWVCTRATDDPEVPVNASTTPFP